MSVVVPAPTALPTGTWTVDPSHSHVEFAITHLGFATVKGRVASFSGTLVGGEQPRLEGTLDLTSLTTFSADRDAHLKAPDFFDTERYPEGRFVAASFEPAGDVLVVRGDLTLRGVTEPVELTAVVTGAGEDPWGNERIGLELEGTIERAKWGIDWNAPTPGGGLLLGGDVRLSASFSLVREG
jgi:polyisoprenoid-binding protein YceI